MYNLCTELDVCEEFGALEVSVCGLVLIVSKECPY